MFDIEWLDIATRLMVAISYLIVSAPLAYTMTRMNWPWKFWYANAVVISWSWSAWYFFLAFTNPPIVPWGVLNRVGHMPVVFLLGLATYFRHNEYRWLTEGGKHGD